MDTIYDNRKQRTKTVINNGSSIYGLGILGAAVFYIQHAATFWEGLLGILKAIFWPAMLLYRAMEALNM